MTTHRRAWIQRAGVVVVLAASALLAPLAQPTLAAPPDLSVNPGSVNLAAGRDATVTVRITTGDLGDSSVEISLTGLPQGVSCASGCGSVAVTPLAPRNHLVTLRAAGNAPANRDTVTVRAVAPSDSSTETFNLTVSAAPTTAPPPVQTVAEVSGRVTDEATGEPVANATVGLLDAQRRSYTTQTNGSGNYRFTGSADRPIAPGSIELGAKKGTATNTLTINARVGQRITNQRIVLSLPVEPTATPSAEPTPEATEEAIADESGAATPPAQAALPQNASDESGSGLGSWLLILVGGLLVALGVGAIVLLWIRRKENEGDAEEETGTTGRSHSAVPASQGGYHGTDPTRVANRAGAGADATMIHRPGLADAPTMMHNRPLVEDEFPDPYGAPLPSQQPPAPQPPSYGGAQPGWGGDGYDRGTPPAQPGYGAAPAGGYGNAPASGAGGYGNAPSSGSGYGNAPASGAGGYGTAPASGGGGYGTAPASGGGGYGTAPASGAGGYGNTPSSGSGYGNAPSSGSGYGTAPASGAGGYGNAPSSGSGYGGPAGGGYGAHGQRDGGETYGGGHGFGGQSGPAGPTGPDYPATPAGGGYGGERYDEPTGRYEGRGAGPSAGAGGSGGADYGPPADPYESGPYGQPPVAGHSRGPEQQQYGQQQRYGQEQQYGPEQQYGQQQPGPVYGQSGGYEEPGGGYPQGGGGRGYDGPSTGGGYDTGQQGYDAGQGGYGSGGGYGGQQQGYEPGPAGYDQPSTGGGYDQRRGYDDQAGGYGRAPEQRSTGYGDQQQDGGYYGDQQQGGHSRAEPPQPPPSSRSERRSLDWLDD